MKKAEADLAAARANVQVDRGPARQGQNVLVGYTKIKSPYDGVITKRNFFRGAFIRSATDGDRGPPPDRRPDGQGPGRHPDPRPRTSPYTTVGDAAEVTLDALGTRTSSRARSPGSPRPRTRPPGRCTPRSTSPIPTTGIRPGMYGIAKVIPRLLRPTPPPSPPHCLAGESQGRQGRRLRRSKTARPSKTEIKVGADDGLRVEVLGGLKPDDDVISNTGSVTDKSPVKVVHDAPASHKPAEAKDSDNPSGKAAEAPHGH